MPRRDDGAGELAALDPDSGEVLVAGDEPPPGPRSRSPAARLRRTAVVLAALSVLSAAGAGYAGSTVAALRRVERVWQTALSLDRQRAAVEDQVLRRLRSYDDEDGAATEPVRRLRTDEALRLVGLEAQLRADRILDPGLSDLRGDMVRALRLRRSALAASPAEPDDRDLLPLASRLEAHLARWRLGGREPVVAPLAEAHRTLQRLSRFADEPTGTVLVGRTGSELVVVDVDGSRVRRRAAPGLDGVFALGDVVVAYGGGGVTAFPLDTTAAPLWSLPGERAFPAVETGRIWIAGLDGVRLLDAEGRPLSGPVPLPAGRTAVAATTGGLLLSRAGGGIELWEPDTAAVARIVSDRGRLVAASRALVGWQEADDTVVRVAPPVPEEIVAHSRLYALRRTDAGPGAFSPDGELLAVPAGPEAGAIARVVIIGQETAGAYALGGPPTTFAGASLTWSADGQWLFWKTHQGRIAFQRRGTRQVRVLRVDVPDLREVTAVTTQDAARLADPGPATGSGPPH